MINVERLITAIEATPGETLAVTKDQLRELLAEVALGQAARRTLVTVGSIARLSERR